MPRSGRRPRSTAKYVRIPDPYAPGGARILKRSPTPKPRARGVPPPPDFSLASLADDTHLTERETAAVLRVSLSKLQMWRKIPDHPLVWVKIAGRVRYLVSGIRAFRQKPERSWTTPDPERWKPLAEASKRAKSAARQCEQLVGHQEEAVE